MKEDSSEDQRKSSNVDKNLDLEVISPRSNTSPTNSQMHNLLKNSSKLQESCTKNSQSDRSMTVLNPSLLTTDKKASSTKYERKYEKSDMGNSKADSFNVKSSKLLKISTFNKTSDKSMTVNPSTDRGFGAKSEKVSNSNKKTSPIKILGHEKESNSIKIELSYKIPLDSGKSEKTQNKNDDRNRKDKISFLDENTNVDFKKGKLAEILHGMKIVLFDFCNRTTAHGFSHIVEEGQPYIMRIFWFGITIIGLFLLLSACYELTTAALVARGTSTEVIYHDVQQKGLKIPHITVCSLAGFWKSKMEYYNVSKSLASYLLLAVRGVEVMSPAFMNDPKWNMVLNMDLKKYLNDHNLTVTEMVNMLSPECEEIILGCFSPSTRLDAAMWWRGSNCCSTFRPVMTSLGRCYTTHDGVPSIQTIAGLLGGHRFLFAVNNDEYMEYDHKIVSATTLAEAGIHISFSNYDQMPSVATNMHALRIAPETAASVGISVSILDRTEHYLDIWPWSQPSCISREDFFAMDHHEKFTLEHNLYFHTYYRTCPLSITSCTAIAFRMPNDTTRECEPADVYNQMLFYKEMMDCVQLDLEIHKTIAKRMCQNTVINQQHSHTTLMEEVIAAQHGITIKPDTHVSMMNVYYPQLAYTEYHERVPTIFTWFSSLGGQMGLFLGASLITLVELLFTTCNVIRVPLMCIWKLLYSRIKKALYTITSGNQ